jgi:two-component system chemotaxis sensor kinase CheA
MDLDAAKGALVEEARELLAAMEAALLEIEESGESEESINAIFRAAHTIKGSAGLFALDLIVQFTHVVESVLVRVRNAELPMDLQLCALMLACGDYMGQLIEALAAGGELVDPDPQTRARLLAELENWLSGAETLICTAESAPATAPAPAGWTIVLRPSADLLRQGMDPLPFIHYLHRYGRVESIEVSSEFLPAFADFDPETCYLGFTVTLIGTASREELMSAFEFIVDDCEIELTPLRPVDASTSAEAVAAGQAGPRALQRSDRRAPEQTMIKLEARKLDELIDAVGEMVIATAGARVLGERRGDLALREALAELEVVVERIRDRSLELRMTPIGEVFQRFPRVVRDVSKELGKKIDLEISGGDAELDKSMVEKLADPLMHIVRNAIDHGIEPTAERLAAGKPESGKVRLNAYHEAGCIVVEIGDDGRGLNRERILAKAVEKGLIAPDASPDPEAIFALIFAPGFSTAEKVTDISGRGVGMDVARQNIEQLRGKIEIESAPGRGSTFRIRLPLTLAIIDGFQVEIGDSSFIVPLDVVEECVDVSGRDRESHIFALRGEALPVIDLAAAFEIRRQAAERQSMVVVRYGSRRAGILIDRFVGEMQAVIKPLGRLLQGVRGLGGSTILGDGSVALILDIPNLITSFVRDKQPDALQATVRSP